MFHIYKTLQDQHLHSKNSQWQQQIPTPRSKTKDPMSTVHNRKWVNSSQEHTQTIPMRQEITTSYQFTPLVIRISSTTLEIGLAMSNRMLLWSQKRGSIGELKWTELLVAGCELFKKDHSHGFIDSGVIFMIKDTFSAALLPNTSLQIPSHCSL